MLYDNPQNDRIRKQLYDINMRYIDDQKKKLEVPIPFEINHISDGSVHLKTKPKQTHFSGGPMGTYRDSGFGVVDGADVEPNDMKGGNFFTDALNVASHVPFSPIAGLHSILNMSGGKKRKMKGGEILGGPDLTVSIGSTKQTKGKKGKKKGGGFLDDIMGGLSNIANVGDSVMNRVAPLVLGGRKKKGGYSYQDPRAMKAEGMLNIDDAAIRKIGDRIIPPSSLSKKTRKKSLKEKLIYSILKEEREKKKEKKGKKKGKGMSGGNIDPQNYDYYNEMLGGGISGGSILGSIGDTIDSFVGLGKKKKGKGMSGGNIDPRNYDYYNEMSGAGFSGGGISGGGLLGSLGSTIDSIVGLGKKKRGKGMSGGVSVNLDKLKPREEMQSSQMAGGKKKVSDYRQFVKDYSDKKGISFKDAMIEIKDKKLWKK